MGRKHVISSGARLLFYFGLSVIMAFVVLIFIIFRAFESDFVYVTNNELMNVSTGIQNTFSYWCDVLKGSASVVAGHPSVIKAVSGRDGTGMSEFLSDTVERLGIDAFALTDSNGIVISERGTQYRKYSDLSELVSVKYALDGKTTLNYGKFGDFIFAEIYASPVVLDGNIIGTVVFVYSLSGKKFIDIVKSFGVECTIFSGDTRVASSLVNVVGTTIGNPLVEEKVLQNGEVFNGRVDVRGIKYYSVYSPICNSDKSVVGMLFVARKMKTVQSLNIRMLQFIIPFCIIIAVVLISMLMRLSALDRRALRQKAEILGRQVNWDALTGANTRKFGTDALEESFLDFRRGFPSPAIMMLDIDNFKYVNDNFGHEAGDEVLRKIVETVYANCRSSDRLIRWGGDEFVGIFDGMKREICVTFSEKVLRSVSALEFNFDGRIHHVTVSIGFAYFSPDDAGYEDALSRADSALYRSKTSGKNTACFGI